MSKNLIKYFVRSVLSEMGRKKTEQLPDWSPPPRMQHHHAKGTRVVYHDIGGLSGYRNRVSSRNGQEATILKQGHYDLQPVYDIQWDDGRIMRTVHQDYLDPIESPDGWRQRVEDEKHDLQIQRSARSK